MIVHKMWIVRGKIAGHLAEFQRLESHAQRAKEG